MKRFITRLFLALLTIGAFFVCLPSRGQGVSGGKLPTRWDKDISPISPLPEYPRPQMVRQRWQSLNGFWDYALNGKAAPPESYTEKILVPYPMESALSGVAHPTAPESRLWYRRFFTVPAAWKGQRILLHFGAVNWQSVVSVNGVKFGEHRGGYTGFDYDITAALKPGENELIVGAWNPVTSDVPDAQVVGKQRVHPVSVLYTAATGIWQSVWIEPVPAVHITELKITPDIDASVLRVTVTASGTNSSVRLVALDGAKTAAQANGKAGTEISLPIANPHLWSPSDPHLYALKITLMQNGKSVDSVESYAAMRKISLGKDAQGRQRIFLNNKFLFQVGLLDQGYWPDGIYTAPTDDALRYDIEIAKQLGVNLLRKHAKVEPDRWYYWTDKLGLLVWQDMPQAFGEGRGNTLSEAAKEQWLTEWKREVAQFYNHPSIIMWTLFNENWGQHDTEAITELTRKLDPTRLINSASGGIYVLRNGKFSDLREPLPAGVGDVLDAHEYPSPRAERPDATRASVVGEYGGISLREAGHLWSAENFGYGAIMRDCWNLTKRYQGLLKEAYALRDNYGVSAVVYTQLTDVELETNGLLTYDRAVIKALPDIVTAANKGEFLPLPPAPAPPVSRDFVPTSELAAQVWQYTTDKPAADWFASAFDASGWKSGPAPFGAGYDGVNTDWKTGDLWLRRKFTLPAVIPSKLNVIVKHDEDVEIYVNGILAASAAGYNGAYIQLPLSGAARATLKPGKNTLAVHCHQTIGGQVLDVGITKAE